MKKEAIAFVFLTALIIIGVSGFASAGAVSCADLMASTGKSAETLCKVNYAGQCCNLDSSPTQTSSGAESYPAMQATYFYTYAPEDCSRNYNPTEGLCEIREQYMKLLNQAIGKYSDKSLRLFNTAIEAEKDYRNNIYHPRYWEIEAQLESCGGILDDSCYNQWKTQFDANQLAEANYQLELIKKLNSDLDALSSSGADSENGGSAGSDPLGSGLWNTNDNRGRDEFGRMMPSFGGFNGDAYVVRSDGTKVIPGRELYLKVDDSVRTGPGSSINIIFSDVGHLSLGASTQLKVGNALLDQFYLATGSLKSSVKFATPDKFEIDTPNAKVFVRGTEYVVDYNETTNTTTIYLNEGTLEITVDNKNLTLTEGNYMIIYANRTTQTGQMNEEKWDALGDNFYDISGSIRVVAYFFLVFIIIELVFLVLLRFWTDRKIKKLNKKDNSTSKGLASIILGIIGLILVFTPYFGIIASGIALSMARIQRANKPTGYAMAGFVLGIIGLILNGLFLIIFGTTMFFI